MMSQRKIEVDMSSKAIDARLREVAQLRKLGLSIAKSRQIPPVETTTSETAAARDDSANCEVRAAPVQE